MKKIKLLLLLIILLASCDQKGATTPIATTELELMATTTSPSGYPASDVILEPTNPYPSNSVTGPRPTPTLLPAYPVSELTWIIKPAGKQCQSYTTDLGTAQSEVENAGITVFNSELAILPVCEACDVCASSEHYRLYIAINDLKQAQELGWVIDEP